MRVSYTYKPVKFFVVTNLIMWAVWLSAAYFSYQNYTWKNGLISILSIIGFLSPFVTALWMIFVSNNTELKQNFYDKLFNLKLIKFWTIPLVFLIVPFAIFISVVLSYIFFNEPMSQLNMVKSVPFAAGFIPAQLLLILVPIIEEIGWKGYGMESLRGKRTFFTATIIFAGLWAFWHGPTFFVHDYYQNMLIKTNPLFAINFIVSFFPVTFIFNWLWYKNRGSILIAILCHLVIDFQGMLQMGQIAKCIETIVFFFFAIIIVSLDKKMFFKEFPAKIGYFE